jgi:hypothetical protein
MIEAYEFIDKNGDGLKERQTSATVQLFNKLSADEINALRAKLNEIITVLNLNSVPLFPAFALKFKGEGNFDLQNLEVGDIVHGFYDANTIWTNAIYNGGDIEDKASYSLMVESFEPQYFVATGTSNEFTLPVGMIAQNVFIDRGVRYKGTEWTQTDGVVTITGTLLASGRKIYITT